MYRGGVCAWTGRRAAACAREGPRSVRGACAPLCQPAALRLDQHLVLPAGAWVPRAHLPAQPPPLDCSGRRCEHGQPTSPQGSLEKVGGFSPNARDPRGPEAREPGHMPSGARAGHATCLQAHRMGEALPESAALARGACIFTPTRRAHAAPYHKRRLDSESFRMCFRALETWPPALLRAPQAVYPCLVCMVTALCPRPGGGWKDTVSAALGAPASLLQPPPAPFPQTESEPRAAHEYSLLLAPP